MVVYVPISDMFKRILNIESTLSRKSIFLFGPRQTGKSTWLKNNYPKSLYINLLSKQVYENYLLNSNSLESDLEIFGRKNKLEIVVIDEVQRIPELLNEVHNQIEKNKNLKFILTGSSARKLKRSGANLLGGRASWKSFFPLVYPEIESEFKTEKDLEKRLTCGGLPSIYMSSAPAEDLDDYIQLYLNEEIKAEGLVRNYEAFHRFLIVASLANTQQINFTEIGSDAQVPPRTVHDYFQILEDTLIGFMLPVFTEATSRKAVSSAKFYFFDTGVSNALKQRSKIASGTPEFGESFEHFVITEIRAYISYNNIKAEMFYWRTTTQIEVDIIIKKENKIYALEIKGKTRVSAKDYSGLIAFAEDFPKAKKYVVVANGRHFIEANQIETVPIFIFLKMLWDKEIF